MQPSEPQALVRFRHLKVLETRSGGDLESTCVHCGLCCFGKVLIEGRPVLLKELHCKFLALQADGTSHCTVYAERRERAPWCASLELGITKSLYPNSCPYVEGLRDYHGPVVLDDFHLRPVDALIRRALRRQPRPEWADPAHWERYLQGGAS